MSMYPANQGGGSSANINTIHYSAHVQASCQSGCALGGEGGGGEGGCPANVNTVGALYMYKHLAMWDD